MAKIATSIRLSKEAHDALGMISRKLGVSKTDVFELSLRGLARNPKSMDGFFGFFNRIHTVDEVRNYKSMSNK